MTDPPHCPTCICGQVATVDDDDEIDGSDRIVRLELHDAHGTLVGVWDADDG